MNKRSLGALIVFNLVLLAAVLVVSLPSSPVSAQGFQGRGGNFVMIAGQVEGRPQQAGLYILDLSKGQLFWVMYNSDTNHIDQIARQNVAADLKLARDRR